MKFNEATPVYPPSLALDLRSKLSNTLISTNSKVECFQNTLSVFSKPDIPVLPFVLGTQLKALERHLKTPKRVKI